MSLSPVFKGPSLYCNWRLCYLIFKSLKFLEIYALDAMRLDAKLFSNSLDVLGCCISPGLWFGQPDLGRVVVVLAAVEPPLPEPGRQRAQLHPEGGAHPAVEEEVERRVDGQQNVRHRAHDQDPQRESAAAPLVVEGDAVKVDDLVDVEKVSGGVEEQEEGDDGEEKDGLAVFLVGVLGWRAGGG